MPIEDRVLNYLDDVLSESSEASKGKRTLLLGNGFSSERDPTFQYGSLWAEAEQTGALPARAKAVAKRRGTTNFEEVLSLLDFLMDTAADYGLPAEGRQAVARDIQQVRDALVRALSKIHLEPTVDIKEDELVSCSLFLSEFDHVFTTNYDLLLYWVLNKAHKLIRAGPQKALLRGFKDGFCVRGAEDSALAFEPDVLRGATNGIHFLHGGLHLYEGGDRTWKRTAPGARRPGGFVIGTLKGAIIKAIENGQLPLIVSEGDSHKKLTRIRQHSYLSFCYDQLRGVEGPIVTFGFAFAEQDDHILQAVAENPGVERIFVSARLVNGKVKARLVEALDRLDQKRAGLVASHPEAYSPLTIHFYDASTACPWNSPYVKPDEHEYWKRDRKPRAP